MRIRSLPFWFGLGLVAIFGFRAVTGIAGGIAYARGSASAAVGHYDTALPFLERAAVGINRYEALWLEAEVRLALYDMLQEVADSGDEQDRLLEEARLGYQAAAGSCPVSGWSWAGLAELYFRLEDRRRSRDGFDLALLARPPWERIGQEGKLAFGFLRWAIAKDPGLYFFREKLVFRSLQFGFADDAADEIVQAAENQPDLWRYKELGDLDAPELLELFATASEGMLDRAPLISRERHLFSLGKLFHRLGDLSKAERYLRSAAEEPSTALHSAEDAFRLALVLKDQGRLEEALIHLDEAALNEAFRLAVYSNRAEIARSRGELDLAFDYLNRCRRMAPRSPRFAMTFATVALQLERYDAAEQALKWMTIIEPGNSTVWAGLTDFYLDTGELAAARVTLRDAAEQLGPDHPALLQLAGKLAERASVPEPGQ